MSARITEKKFAMVKKFIADKRDFTLDEIANICGISTASVRRIYDVKDWEQYEAQKAARDTRKLKSGEYVHIALKIKAMSDALLSLAEEFEAFANSLKEG